MSYCNCPRGASISNLTLSGCPQNFGQIQKVIFQRVFSSGSTKNAFAAISGATSAELLASWTPLLAAVDGTKVVQSPFLSNPESEPGAKRERGGGNASLGGIPEVIGREPSTFAAQILQNSQEVIKEMKDYMCEEVGVFYVNEFGQIGGLTDDIATPVTFSPIPLRGLFVGDKKFGGLEDVDMNVVDYYHLPNWSDNFYVTTPTDFNALYDLVTP